MKNVIIIAVLCLLSCTNTYYLTTDPMFSFHSINYPALFVADDKNGTVELDIKDSLAFLKAKLNQYSSHTYYFYDTLKPFYGTTCTKYSPPYGCPCKGVFLRGQCDCQDCLDSSKDVIFYRGKLSQIYIGRNGYIVCNLEDTVRTEIYWHRVFNLKIPNEKYKKMEKQ